MPKIVYSRDYQVDIGEHVFPTIKYRLIYERLIKGGGFSEQDFLEPEPAADEDLLLVHTPEYIEKLKRGRLSPMEVMALELPYSRELMKASWLCVGGTIMACRDGCRAGIGIHIGGGFHHAFPDHGEGFCVLNDVAVGARRLQADGRIKKALIVDCDLHQGNGTAAIFADDEDIFTFSIHQQNNYPFRKPPSNLDVGLSDGAGDKEYLQKLQDSIPKIIKEFSPEFILYVAGSDPYEGDQLGALDLSIEGLKKRDEFIFGLARDYKVPIAVALAGGYAKEVQDTVTIHCNTIESALSIFDKR